MDWKHKVDRAWLEARKNYLTASEIQKLIPFTPTGRARTGMDEAYLKVWAEKQCKVSEDDLVSSGAMARGHILEPYAIGVFNDLGVLDKKLYHWDDALFYSPDEAAVSPDALSFPQLGSDPARSGHLITEPVVYLGEVKSYSGAMHYTCGLADPMSLEERWQIATAFYVIPSIKTAALIFFNPSAEHPLFYHLYDRKMLAKELTYIAGIVLTYDTMVKAKAIEASSRCPSSVKDVCISEEDIITQLLEDQAVTAGINP